MKKSRILLIVVCISLFIGGIWIGKSIFGNKGGDTPPPVPSYFSASTTSDSATVAAIAFSGTVLEVKDGGSIQEAVSKAVAGDMIRVYPGTYKETVYIDKDNIILQGVIQQGKWPTLEGEGIRNDGILYSGNGIMIENFKITNYKGNGIMGQAGNNYVIRNNWVIDAGVYGIFPEFGKNGLIEHNVLTGIKDAAIYVGMCDNVDVLHNEVYGNVAGIEIENTRHALVENNYAHDNTGGILAFITPGLPIKTAYDIIIRNNFVINNNHENFGAPGSIVAGIPPGTGILIMAADQVTIENNIITGNDNAGITITDLAYGANMANDPESEPNPDNIVILDNFMANNGNNPVGELKALMLARLSKKGPDIISVGGGQGGCIRDINRYRTVGLDNYAQCEVTNTKAVHSYLTAEVVPPRKVSLEEKGKMAYYGICAGCHAYNVRMIGPATSIIQALYYDNPEGIRDYINNPIRKREDYPEMPPQNYLPEDVKLAVAEYLLTISK